MVERIGDVLEIDQTRIAKFRGSDIAGTERNLLVPIPAEIGGNLGTTLHRQSDIKGGSWLSAANG